MTVGFLKNRRDNKENLKRIQENPLLYRSGYQACIKDVKEYLDVDCNLLSGSTKENFLNDLQYSLQIFSDNPLNANVNFSPKHLLPAKNLFQDGIHLTTPSANPAGHRIGRRVSIPPTSLWSPPLGQSVVLRSFCSPPSSPESVVPRSLCSPPSTPESASTVSHSLSPDAEQKPTLMEPLVLSSETHVRLERENLNHSSCTRVAEDLHINHLHSRTLKARILQKHQSDHNVIAYRKTSACNSSDMSMRKSGSQRKKYYHTSFLKNIKPPTIFDKCSESQLSSSPTSFNKVQDEFQPPRLRSLDAVMKAEARAEGTSMDSPWRPWFS